MASGIIDLTYVTAIIMVITYVGTYIKDEKFTYVSFALSYITLRGRGQCSLSLPYVIYHITMLPSLIPTRSFSGVRTDESLSIFDDFRDLI